MKRTLGFAFRTAIVVLVAAVVYGLLIELSAMIRGGRDWTGSALAMTPIYVGFLAIALTPIMVLTQWLRDARRRFWWRTWLWALGLAGLYLYGAPMPLAIGNWWTAMSCFIAGVVGFWAANRLLPRRQRPKDE